LRTASKKEYISFLQPFGCHLLCSFCFPSHVPLIAGSPPFCPPFLAPLSFLECRHRPPLRIPRLTCYVKSPGFFVPVSQIIFLASSDEKYLRVMCAKSAAPSDPNSCCFLFRFPLHVLTAPHSGCQTVSDWFLVSLTSRALFLFLFFVSIPPDRVFPFLPQAGRFASH